MRLARRASTEASSRTGATSMTFLPAAADVYSERGRTRSNSNIHCMCSWKHISMLFVYIYTTRAYWKLNQITAIVFPSLLIGTLQLWISVCIPVKVFHKGPQITDAINLDQ